MAGWAKARGLTALMAGAATRFFRGAAGGGSEATPPSEAAQLMATAFGADIHRGGAGGGPASTLLERHPLPPQGHWPFGPVDFERLDESEDIWFYAQPRLVHHIDEGARQAWTQYLRRTLVSAGGGPADAVEARPIEVLDLCSSWVSHLPDDLSYKRVVGHGMNEAELRVNPQLTDVIVRDLNKEAALPEIHDSSLDAVICTVSIDYLTDPRGVVAEVQRVLRPGGTVHFGFSNRCFPTKVIGLWREASDYGRLWIVAAYLHHAGFEGVAVQELQTAGYDPYFVATATKRAKLRSEL